MSIEKLLARAQDVRTDDVVVDEITVRVREPSGAAHARYSQLWAAGRSLEAFAVLLAGCVVDTNNTPCLTAEQATALAGADSSLTLPIVNAILRLTVTEKKAHAPGADGVPDQHAPGAPSI